MATVFITGSGTDIGKTFVCCRLLAALPAALKVRCIKPVVTGFDPSAVATSDPGRLLAAQGLPADDARLATTSPWRFRDPVSADMAARREDRSIPFAELVDFCRPPAGVDLNLVEGLGGVMAPLDAEHTILDLIEALNAAVVLVVGSYLGALSHALTAFEAIRNRSLPLLTTVISQSDSEPVPTAETAATLERFIAGTPLVVLPRDDNASAAELAALVQESL
jgi:dethiobiotin synthetase